MVWFLEPIWGVPNGSGGVSATCLAMGAQCQGFLAFLGAWLTQRGEVGSAHPQWDHPLGNLLENLWDRTCSISPQDEGSGSKDLLCLEVTLVKTAELCSGPDKSIYSKCYANFTRI